MTPICLPQESDARISPEENCFVAGWGRLEDKGSSASTLQELEVGIINNQECTTKASYGKYAGYPVIDDHMFCAGHMGGKKDACSGDSGGPLMCVENGRPVLRGAVSWGIGRAQTERIQF